MINKVKERINYYVIYIKGKINNVIIGDYLSFFVISFKIVIKAQIMDQILQDLKQQGYDE